jgi:acyl carrier protein
MTEEQLINAITEILGRIAQSKGSTLPKVGAGTRLLGGGLPIDSLDLAQLVVELVDVTDYDPFESGFVDFRTIGELAKLFQP